MAAKKAIVLGLLAAAIIAVTGTAVVLRGRIKARRVHADNRPAVPVVTTGDPNFVIRFAKNPESAPGFEAQDLAGKKLTKVDWAGKVVLVNFWATWCPPCRIEIPELIELQKLYGDRLQIIGISEDDDPPEKVAKFAKEHGMNYPIVMSTPEIVASYGGVPALPTTFMIDPKGKVVTKHTGIYPIESYHEEIRSLLGMPTNGRLETFVDTGQIFLKNAANATELPNVDFSGLSEDQKKTALHRMNAETCTCGCKLTVSQCRVNDSECPVSVKIAADIVHDTAHAVPASGPDAGGAKPVAR